MIDEKLLDIVACPVCKGPLELGGSRNELVCRFDRLAFPVREGIPVLLEDQARTMDAGEID